MPNRFLANNIIIKNKSLPLYEQNGIYNIKMRKFKKLDTLHDFNLYTSVLTKNVKCGSLWDNIKKFFKKGKDFASKALNTIDNSPLLSTVKDIASDYIYEKTGVNPNDYYDIAKTVVKNTPEQNMNALLKTTSDTLTNTYKKYKDNKKNNIKTNQPTKKQQLKTFMNDFTNNLKTSYPNYAPIIDNNYRAFAQGVDELSSGSIDLDVWKKKAPIFLMSSMNSKGGMIYTDSLKDLLKKRFNITDVRLTPTMKKLLMKGPIASKGESEGRLNMGKGDEGCGDELSTGRLYQGRGDEGCGKKQNMKYAKLLASL